MNFDSQPETASAPPPRTSLWAVVGLLGCLAVVVGFFLPWMTLTKEVRDQLKLSKADLEAAKAQVKANTDDERVAEVAKKLLANEPVGGPDWIVILRHEMQKDGGPKSEKDRRSQNVMMGWLQATAYAAGALALLILLARARALSAPVLAMLAVVGALYGGPALYGWLVAARRSAEDVAADQVTIGLGAQAVAGGGCAMVLAGLFGVRRKNWWLAYLFILLLLIGALVFLGVYVGNAE